MDFMGIGPLEILLILILGFLLFGPDKLPGMAAKAGRLYRNFKKTTFDLSKTITEELPTENKVGKSGKTPSETEAKGTEIASKAGQLYRGFKKATSDLSNAINEELSVENGDKKGSEATLTPESTEKPTPPAKSDEKAK